MKNQFFSESEFYCTQCGSKGIPVLRKRGQEREAGHLKNLFCLTCGKEQNHVECKPYTRYTHEDFLIEFENGNFDKNGKRIKTYGELRDELNKKGLLYNE